MSFPRFLELPQEIRVLILCECDYPTLKQYSKTSKTIREELFDNGLFWRIKTEKDFGRLSSGNLQANLWRTAYMKFFEEAKFRFHDYIWGDKEEVVKDVLRAGIDPHTLSCRGDVPLIEAACNDNLGIGEALLKVGADINMSEGDGNTALIWASFYGHLEIVRMLLERGADPNLQDKEGGRTALMFASSEGHLEVVKELLTYDADPNLQDKYGNTALARLLEEGHEKIARILIKRGADPHIQDDEGKTAWDKAIELGVGGWIEKE